MRMRRKNNLEERALAASPYLLDLGNDSLDARKEVVSFLNIDNLGKDPVLELGCGKGKYALEYAKIHNQTAYVAVEQITNVIIEGAEKAKQEKLDNLLFLRTGAEYLKRYFKDNTFKKVVLNFPCPFHKETYRDRRLTSERFLEIYDSLLTDDGEIRLKTDNKRMFEYSLESMSEYGFAFKNLTLDLHSSPYIEGDIVTEYESKFIKDGLPIYSVVAYKPTRLRKLGK